MQSILEKLFELLSSEEDRISNSSLEEINRLRIKFEKLKKVDVYSGFDNYDFND